MGSDSTFFSSRFIYLVSVGTTTGANHIIFVFCLQEMFGWNIYCSIRIAENEKFIQKCKANSVHCQTSNKGTKIFGKQINKLCIFFECWLFFQLEVRNMGSTLNVKFMKSRVLEIHFEKNNPINSSRKNRLNWLRNYAPSLHIFWK